MIKPYLWVFLDKSHWHKSSKSRSYGMHIQLAHPLQYPMLQLNLLLLPIICQSSIPRIQIPHTMPRQMGRCCKERLLILLFQPQTQPYTFCYSLSSHCCQREVHSMKCHPINFLFPTFPSPKRSCISISTNIQEITQVIGGSLML